MAGKLVFCCLVVAASGVLAIAGFSSGQRAALVFAMLTLAIANKAWDDSGMGK